MPEEPFVSWASIPQSSWGTSSALQYQESRQVGKGTYGSVFLGTNILTNTTVALKKVSWRHSEQKHRHRGFPLNALREIRLLKNKCSHPNLVKLLDVAAYIPSVSNGQKSKSLASGWEDEEDGFVYLVFEYIEHDLAGILDYWRDRVRFSIPAVKCLMKQLFEAMAYLHEQSICHRDLKCSNLLVSSDNRLKLADFGLARELNTDGVLSPKVVTLWYRAPELLLGDTKYTSGVDMWSVGCILLELLKSTPMFPGKDELDQMKKIFGVCGYPTVSEWPGYTALPGSKQLLKLEKEGPPPITTSISNVEDFCLKRVLDPDGAHLASRLLALDPSRRCSAQQGLQSKFLADAPLPNKLPPLEADASLHEWETKKAKKNRSKEDQSVPTNDETQLHDTMPTIASEPIAAGPKIRSDVVGSIKDEDEPKQTAPVIESGVKEGIVAEKAPGSEEEKRSHRDNRRNHSPFRRRRERSPSGDSRNREHVRGPVGRSKRSPSPWRKKDRKRAKRSRSPSRRHRRN